MRANVTDRGAWHACWHIVKARASTVFAAALLIVMSGTAVPAQVLDRVVAVVNSDVITLSDWQQHEDFAALLEGRPPVTALDYNSLPRLMDQLLLEEQARNVNFNRVTPAEVAQEERNLRKQIPNAALDSNWHAILARYNLTEQDFVSGLASRMDVLRFIDLRFRPAVRIGREAEQAYYNQTFVPQLKKVSPQAAPPPFEEVRIKIRDILVEQRLDEMVATWMQALHAQSHVQLLINPDGSPVANSTAR